MRPSLARPLVAASCRKPLRWSPARCPRALPLHGPRLAHTHRPGPMVAPLLYSPRPAEGPLDGPVISPPQASAAVRGPDHGRPAGPSPRPRGGGGRGHRRQGGPWTGGRASGCGGRGVQSAVGGRAGTVRAEQTPAALLVSGGHRQGRQPRVNRKRTLVHGEVLGEPQRSRSQGPKPGHGWNPLLWRGSSGRGCLPLAKVMRLRAPGHAGAG